MTSTVPERMAEEPERIRVKHPTVRSKRQAIRSLVGGRHASTRLSKETLTRVYYVLSDDDPPTNDRGPTYWRSRVQMIWSDLERREKIADLAGFDYDPASTSAPRSYNSDELDRLYIAIVEAMTEDDDG